MKKILKISVLVLISVLILSVNSFAAENLIYNDFEYSVSENGTVKIEAYKGTDETVVIPDEIDGKSVTVIGEKSFEGSAITSVVIPLGIKEIGSEAFKECENITEIHIPASVEKMGRTPFKRASGLAKITVDENNEYFTSKNGVLYNKDMTTLLSYPAEKTAKTFNIPASVERLEEHSIDGNDYLSKVKIGKNVNVIGSYCFFDCMNLKSLTIPATVEFIGEDASIGRYDAGRAETGDLINPSVPGFVLYAYRSTPGEEYCGIDGVDYKLIPGTVKNLKATKTDKTVTLKWNKLNGATGYKVYIFNKKTGKYRALAVTSKTTYTVKNLKGGTDYKFAVKAYTDYDGEKLWATSFESISLSTKPAEVKVKLSSKNKAANLSWNKVTGATGYVVYMKNANGNYKRLAVTKDNEFVKKNLVKGKTYTFAVRAYKNSNGKNLYSSYKSYELTIK